MRLASFAALRSMLRIDRAARRGSHPHDEIPRVIHQTWKTTEVPVAFRTLQKSWIHRNPGFTYRFWTDEDLARFVHRDCRSYLPLFTSYTKPIARVDLARYLVMKTFGGVYADLDCECLRPIDALVAHETCLIGLEPDSHVALQKAVDRGLTRILCPSVIASVPDHPFWDHVLACMSDVRDAPDVLDATGPFLLTRAYESYRRSEPVTLVDADRLYPVAKDDCWSGRVHDPVFRESAIRDAFTLHYWEGTWFRSAGGRSAGLPADAAIEVTGSAPRPDVVAAANDALPLISCLMVTRNRGALAANAIRCFLDQTYPRRELLIVDDAPGDEMVRLVAGLGRPEIRLVRLPDGRLPLGALRNIAVEHAAGEYVCQWDDDDLYDASRLEYQYGALVRAGADACMLRRVVIWWPAERRVAVSNRRDWEGTLLCRKTAMLRYPHLRRGEDTVLVDDLCRLSRVARLDAPTLYAYVVHGSNTFERSHFEPHWEAATERIATDRYPAVLEDMRRRMPVDGYIEALESSRDARAPVGVTVAGHLGAAVGLGAAARATVASLYAAGLPFTALDLPLDETHPDVVSVPTCPAASAAVEKAAFAVTLVHTNPDALLQALNDPRSPISARSLRERFTIGYWAWEGNSGIPRFWNDALPLVREIWVPSEFTAAAVSAHVGVPVTVVPHAIPRRTAALDRRALGIPDDAFCFLFVFDATSNVARKNPAGVIRAYRIAFHDADSGALLIVKAKKLSDDDARALQALADGRPDIRIINEPYSPERAHSLIAACDVYVSLHRAEGFGLTIAEAMSCGKPVIATAYSGNMDYMTPETAYLVPYTLTALDRDDGYYARGTLWAKPDVKEAARVMRRLFKSRDEARATGARAAEWVDRHLSPLAVGARIRARLTALAAEEPPSAAPRPRIARDSAPRVLVLTPVKDGARHLQRYVQLLNRLDFDPARLSVAFLESDSQDDSFEQLVRAVPVLERRYRKAEVFRHDYGFHPNGARWAPAIQRRRREVLARSRNRLLASALEDQAWVLWLDVDLVDYPPDLLARLLETGRDVVVPHCVFPDGRTFDLNTFCFAAGRQAAERPEFLVDGLYQPPPGEGRVYLDAFSGESITPVDSVGGTALLIRADLHREGLCFPPFPYRGYIETEGLAMMAADMGTTCSGLPDLRIVHAGS